MISTGCPTTELVAGLIEGSLDPDSTTTVQRHLVNCRECFHVFCESTEVLVRLETLDQHSPADSTKPAGC